MPQCGRFEVVSPCLRSFCTRPQNHASAKFTMKNHPHLVRGDCLLLASFGIAFFLLASFASPRIGVSGAVNMQSAREMQATGDWLQPTVGGAPMLDRPPVAQWLALSIASSRLMGVETASRLICVSALVLIACLAAHVAALVFGRRTGLLAGLTTMTTASLVQAVGEANADLVSSVALMLAVTSYLDCERIAKLGCVEPRRFPGSLYSGRSRDVLQFFTATTAATFVCGMTVTAFALLVPIVFTLSTSQQRSSVRRVLWLWGLLAVLAAGVAWPMIVCLRVPGASHLWWPLGSLSDGLAYFSSARLEGRLKAGVVTAFTVSVSWGLLLPLGLWWTRHDALGDRRSTERLIWAFAIAGPAAAAFCLEQPRPVLIAAVALWNMLAAVGSERSVEASLQTIRALLNRARVSLPVPALPVSRLTIASAFGCFAGVFVPLFWSDTMQFRPFAVHQTVLDQAIKERGQTDQIAVDTEAGDDATVALFQLRAQGRSLHNLSFLLDGPPSPNGVLVLTRRVALDTLTQLGHVSEVSPEEAAGTDDELMLCRVRVNPALCRRSKEAVPMTLAQATHREAGPWLRGMQVSSKLDSPELIAIRDEDEMRR